MQFPFLFESDYYDWFIGSLYKRKLKLMLFAWLMQVFTN